jgi:hypothetical protein
VRTEPVFLSPLKFRFGALLGLEPLLGGFGGDVVVGRSLQAAWRNEQEKRRSVSTKRQERGEGEKTHSDILFLCLSSNSPKSKIFGPSYLFSGFLSNLPAFFRSPTTTLPSSAGPGKLLVRAE